MTPKEKAAELIDKFENYSFIDIDQKISSFSTAKQCALIVVDEIFEFMKMDDDLHEDAHFANSKWVQYWIKVKQEIEKL